MTFILTSDRFQFTGIAIQVNAVGKFKLPAKVVKLTFVGFYAHYVRFNRLILLSLAKNCTASQAT